jgi:hypothetical protein
MATNNDGHISFLGQAAANDPAANRNVEKHVGHDIDSVYDDDEEAAIATKESDFKRKQVCAFSGRRDLF